MDSIRRLQSLVRSWLNDDDGWRNDPHWQSAWNELEAYLNVERTDTTNAATAASEAQELPAELQPDLRAIEAPPNASYAEARQAYLRMLNRYHPDRWSDDSEKRQLATQITAAINASWQRLNHHYRTQPLR